MCDRDITLALCFRGQRVVLEADIAGLAPITPLLKVQPGFFIVPSKRVPA
jgi:hypothetical protein